MYEEKDGKCVLTAKAEINPYHIEKILGKASVKGSKKIYEYIYIKAFNCDFEGVLLTERKNLNFDVVTSFIETYYNGDRSVENHPYYADLKDNELLDDLDIEVLTYKIFYSISGLRTRFYPCKRNEITEELRESLKEKTKKAEEEKISWDNHIKSINEKGKLIFNSIN